MPNWNQGQSPTAPAQGGDLKWNSDVGQLMVYNGSSWVPLHPATNDIPAATGAVSADGNTNGLGLTYIAITNGTPSMTPNISGTTNMAAIAIDIGAGHLWVYDGQAWKTATLA